MSGPDQQPEEAWRRAVRYLECTHCNERSENVKPCKCWLAFYCPASSGRECQKEHWSSHKAVCTSRRSRVKLGDDGVLQPMNMFRMKITPDVLEDYMAEDEPGVIGRGGVARECGTCRENMLFNADAYMPMILVKTRSGFPGSMHPVDAASGGDWEIPQLGFDGKRRCLFCTHDSGAPASVRRECMGFLRINQVDTEWVMWKSVRLIFNLVHEFRAVICPRGTMSFTMHKPRDKMTCSLVCVDRLCDDVDCAVYVHTFHTDFAVNVFSLVLRLSLFLNELAYQRKFQPGGSVAFKEVQKKLCGQIDYALNYGRGCPVRDCGVHQQRVATTECSDDAVLPNLLIRLFSRKSHSVDGEDHLRIPTAPIIYLDRSPEYENDGEEYVLVRPTGCNTVGTDFREDNAEVFAGEFSWLSLE